MTIEPQASRPPSWSIDRSKLILEPVGRFFQVASLLGPYGRILQTFARLPSPTLVTDRRWDAIFLLDACRLDLFRALFPSAPGIVSPGSTTLSWARENFVDNPASGQLQDTALVTANPWTSREYFRTQGWLHPFAQCDSLLEDAWDQTYDTVLPETVAEAAERALDSGVPRLMVHFIQPHAPFIAGGPPPGAADKVPGRAHRLTWRRIRDGTIPRAWAMRAYEDNLRLVLRYARRLADQVDGKVVLTSDHGNLFGEYGLYGHPDVRVPELAWVPWLEWE